MSVHEINDVVVVTSSFYNSNGQLTNPTGLTFSYRKPDGSTASYTLSDAELVNDSVGTYHVNLTVDAAGAWFWSWVATGAVADADHGYFYVRANWSKILTSSELRMHTETDLTGNELDAIIAAESAFMDDILGPATTDSQFFRNRSDPSEAERYYSDQRFLNPRELQLRRPAAAITSIVERDEDDVTTTLSSDDYRVINPFIIERLDTGTNQRSDWGVEITVTFIPQDSVASRRQALIELCKLTIASQGYSRIQDNEIQLHPINRTLERIAIVSQEFRGVPFA